jgi:hypothetical protein
MAKLLFCLSLSDFSLFSEFLINIYFVLKKNSKTNYLRKKKSRDIVWEGVDHISQASLEPLHGQHLEPLFSWVPWAPSSLLVTRGACDVIISLYLIPAAQEIELGCW